MTPIAPPAPTAELEITRALDLARKALFTPPNGALVCRWCHANWTVDGHTEWCHYVEICRDISDAAEAIRIAQTKLKSAPAPQGEQEPTPWTIDGSMPLPACRNDHIRRADVVTMWNNWRQGLPPDRPFRHSDGVDFLNRLNDIAGSEAGVSARVLEVDKALLKAAKRALTQMCIATAPSNDYTDAVDELDTAVRAALGVSPVLTPEITGISASYNVTPLPASTAELHRYTITSEGASLGYFRLVEDKHGAWVTWAEVEALFKASTPPGWRDEK